jgi:transcriptional regulator with XRE-family HTH domain
VRHEIYNFDEVDFMAVKDAVVQRFQQICSQRGIKPNELATLSGVTPSTVYSMMENSRRDLSIITIKKLCDGLDMTLGEFFSTPEFDALEQEIQ